MALIVKDRVQETSTTTGTGTFTLDGANSGFATFSSAVGNGNTTYYAIVGGTEWEVGIGTVGAGTLARTTLLASSTGSAISFSAGIKNVFCTYPAGKSVTIDDIQTLTNKTINLSSNTLTGTTAQFNTALSDGDFATLAGTETLTNKALNGTLGATTPSTIVATTTTANSFIPNLSTVPTNGLYLPATNSVGFSTNSTERMRIDSSGKLGLGVIAPTYILDISQSLNGDAGARVTNANAGAATIANFTATNGTSFSWYGQAGTAYGGYAQIRANGAGIYANGSGGIGLSADNAAGIITFGTGSSATEKMRISSTGGVSIGNTTDPGATNLSVTGKISIGANQAVNGPAFSAYASSAQTLNGGAATKVNFGTEEFDTNNNFASSRFTPTVAGYYQVNAQVYTGTPQSRFIVYLLKNGAGCKTGNDFSSIAYGNTMGALVYMNGSTDYLEIYAYFSTTGNTNFAVDATWFNGAMVRGA
jgi:hypothetical protein